MKFGAESRPRSAGSTEHSLLTGILFCIVLSALTAAEIHASIHASIRCDELHAMLSAQWKPTPTPTPTHSHWSRAWMTSCALYPRSPHRRSLANTLHFPSPPALFSLNITSPVASAYQPSFSTMSWMDSWSRPNKHATTPPPLYLTVGDSVPYCHTCGRVIGERRKHGTSEIKYCSARCRNNKPGPMDRNIEAAFAALLNGATPESLHASQDQEPQPEQPTPEPRPEKKHKKNKRSKTVKGDHRIIVDCQTVQDVVFQREKDPEKVYGRRKNRKARFVVEKPEDWRSVDMIDHPNSSPAPPQSVTSLASDDDNNNNNNNNSNHLADNLVSDSDPDENEGGIVLETSKPPPQTNPTGTLDAATPQDPDSLPDTVEYGYGSGKVRPPQHQNDINGSVGGEKGWAERSQETPDMKAKRREGQRRADEREKVRQAARRGCAFGFAVAGDQEEKKKCEAVMKGTVVEASFAKGEWGVRWRERV